MKLFAILLILVLITLSSCSKSKEEVARLVVDSLYRTNFNDELQAYRFNNYRDDMLKELKLKDKPYVLGEMQKAFEDRKSNIKRQIEQLQQ